MMRNKNSFVDIFFVLIIFCVLCLSMVLVVNLGSLVYKKIVQTMDNNFNYYTSLNYIKEKVQQNDEANSIVIKEVNNQDTLVFNNNSEIKTYLYFDEGYIKELTVLDGQDLNFSAGEKIVQIEKFDIRIENNLLYLSLFSTDQKDLIIFLASKGSKV
ncbi:MAG: DUF4860 domain-containing protein [Erysipelotrichaceae bacterium]